MARATGAAACAPSPACSIIAATTYLACPLAGAQDANQEVSCLPKTSAVPVLPPTSTLSSGKPANATDPEAPLAGVNASEDLMKFSTDPLTGTLPRDFDGICRTTLPSGSTTARPSPGSQSVPPLTSAEYAVASGSGVTVVSPCPIARLAASPTWERQPSEQFSAASRVRNERRAPSVTSG